MKTQFIWNPHADQPHNVASRKERFRSHLAYLDSYLTLAVVNLASSIPVLRRYRSHRQSMYARRVVIDDPFLVSVTPQTGLNEELLECFRELGVRQTLIRILSWERQALPLYESSFRFFAENGIDITGALVQRRDDVLRPRLWEGFVRDAMSHLSPYCRRFEVGHAWNRTKWGVWDHREYLALARPAVAVAEKLGVETLGPAVIDFEFHLYLPVLRSVRFDTVSSHLYVDRVGAPENKQFGWDLPRKIALLRAIIDSCPGQGQDLWITEANWPLKGTGRYSPASGKPNVSEDDQARYLVRYYLLALSSGLVQKINWWQLVAPGYGLIDSRGASWRKRPAYDALKTLAANLKGSTFLGVTPHRQARLFRYVRGGRSFTAAWSPAGAVTHRFSQKISRVQGMTGGEVGFRDNTVRITGNPQYIHFEPSGPEPDSALCRRSA